MPMLFDFIVNKSQLTTPPCRHNFKGRRIETKSQRNKQKLERH